MSLPGLLGEIERVAGKSAAERLALHAGGTEMTFSPRPKGALAKIVGAEAAKLIAQEFGGQKFTIPMAHLRGQKGRRAQVAQMLAAEASNNTAAKVCDVHERTVRRVREKLKVRRGLPLFPDE